MTHHHFDRRKFVRNTLLASGALAAPGLTRFARASVPASKSFDLSAGSAELFSNTQIHHNTIMQCLAFDNVNHYIYVAQVTGQDSDGDSAYHAARGDMTVCKLDWAGNYLAWMKLQGCGHGFSMAVNNSPDGTPWIWIEYAADTAHLSDGAAYGRKITRFRWTNSTTLTSTDLAAHQHDPRPGSYHNSPSIDPVNNRIAIRYQPVLGDATKKVVVYKLTDVESSSYSSPLADITLPASCYNSAQGFTLYGDYLYFLSGGPSSACPGTQASSTSKVAKININTKTVTGPINTYADYQLGYREPEGMAIQVENGSPRLCFGLAAHQAEGSGCNDNRTVNVCYKSVLTSTAD